MPVYAGGYEASAWYITEGTEGSTPAGTYLALANNVSIKEVESPTPNGVRQSGSVDYGSFQKGYPKPMLTCTFHPTQANGLNFLANLLSTDISFTLSTKNQNLNTFYRRYVGCKVKTSSVKVKLYPKEDVVEIICEIWGWSIQYSDQAGMSYETIPSTAVNWSDVTLKVNAATITDWWEINFDVSNDLYRVPTPSSGATQSIKRGVRECKGDFTRAMTTSDFGQTEIQASEAATVTSFEVDLVSHTFQFTGGVYTEVEITNEMTEIESKKLSFQGAVLTVT